LAELSVTAYIVSCIGGAQAIIGAIVSPALDFIDSRQVVRRAMVLIVLWQLVDAYIWAKGFAARPGMSGTEIAAVIAAITGPVTILQGFLFRMYDASRQQPNKGLIRRCHDGRGQRNRHTNSYAVF
jgi:hypothetical protein